MDGANGQFWINKSDILLEQIGSLKHALSAEEARNEEESFLLHHELQTARAEASRLRGEVAALVENNSALVANNCALVESNAVLSGELARRSEEIVALQTELQEARAEASERTPDGFQDFKDVVGTDLPCFISATRLHCSGTEWHSGQV